MILWLSSPGRPATATMCCCPLLEAIVTNKAVSRCERSFSDKKALLPRNPPSSSACFTSPSAAVVGRTGGDRTGDPGAPKGEGEGTSQVGWTACGLWMPTLNYHETNPTTIPSSFDLWASPAAQAYEAMDDGRQTKS